MCIRDRARGQSRHVAVLGHGDEAGLVAATQFLQLADGAHGRFGAGGNQTHHFLRRDEFAEQVGDIDFALSRSTESQAVNCCSLYGGDDFRVGMAKNCLLYTSRCV